VTASQSNQPTRDLTISLEMPLGTDLISPDNGGTVNGRTVRWTNATLTQNTNRIFTVQARAINSLTNGTVLTAVADAAGATATDTTTVQSGPGSTKSYALTLTDNKSSVRAGDTLNYVLTVKNNSTSAQTDTVTVQGSASLTVQSGTPLPTSVGTNNVTWSNVSFNAGETKTFTFNAQVASNVRTGTTIDTRATVASATLSDLTRVDNNASSSSRSSSSRSSSSSRRSASSSSVRAAGNPLFRLTANASEVAPNGEITYTLFVQNVLLLTIRDATASVRFDPNAASVGNIGNGVNAGNGEIRWGLTPLAPGQVWQTAFTLRANGALSNGSIVTATGRLQGTDVNGSTLNERVSVETVRVLSADSLPDTGAAFDALFLALSGALAVFMGVMQKRSLGL
jgi:uncharacterized repeat protein (TIGR01451 family)